MTTVVWYDEHTQTRMGKRKKRNKNTLFWNGAFEDLKKETLQGILAIACFVIGFFLILAALQYAGVVGRWTFSGISYVLGIGYFMLPILFFVLGFSFARSLSKSLGILKLGSALLFFLAGLGLVSALFPEEGGLAGELIASPLIALFDIYSTFLILGALLIISLLLILDANLSVFSLDKAAALFRKKERDATPIVTGADTDDSDEEEEGQMDEDEREKVPGEEGLDTPRTQDAARTIGFRNNHKADDNAQFIIDPMYGEYTPPPLSLLEKDKGKPGVGDIKANANIIKRTMQNFGINVQVDEISIGPSVTRYALKPAEGVRLSRILALQNNLELALAAYPVRIEAPIPGRSLVGIEVPNTAKTTVGLATLLSNDSYQGSEKPLLVTLGKDISGQSHFANLSKMPHLLIAGTTGSGKSVTIHAIITSLLFRNAPQMLRFIMVDPKRVELTLYNNIPHLLTPVVTDAKKTILTLKWAAKEMDRRYDILEEEAVRDIESYHQNVVKPALEKSSKKDSDELPEAMPYIVIVIDELADIMQAYPRELESAIVRLAQMSRAVGIHLILSTQRPSVNIITGLIKANIPARIALQVSSQIDSRTILDAGGAEKLLGAGDMLYLSGEMSKPKRIQSAFISETELKKVTSYLVKNNEHFVPDDIDFSGESGGGGLFAGSLGNDEDDDELYHEARDVVVRAGKASTSYLQRKLRIGYARAARLIDLLEERGVIGPADGAKPREVLVRREDDSRTRDEEDDVNNRNPES